MDKKLTQICNIALHVCQTYFISLTGITILNILWTMVYEHILSMDYSAPLVLYANFVESLFHNASIVAIVLFGPMMLLLIVVALGFLYLDRKRTTGL